MDVYGPEEDMKKPWTEQETLLLLEVSSLSVSAACPCACSSQD